MFASLCTLDVPYPFTTAAVAPGNHRRVLAIGFTNGMVMFGVVGKKSYFDSQGDIDDSAEEEGANGSNKENDNNEQEEDEMEEDEITSSSEPSEGRSRGYCLKELASLDLGPSAISSLSWSDDSKKLAIGKRNGEIALFDTELGEISWTNEVANEQEHLSPKDTKSKGNKINNKQVNEGDENNLLQDNIEEMGAVSALTFYGNRIVAGYDNGGVRVYDSLKNEYSQALDAADYISALSVQGRLICASSGDGSVYTYRIPPLKSSRLILKLVQISLTEEQDISYSTFLDGNSHKLRLERGKEIKSQVNKLDNETIGDEIKNKINNLSSEPSSPGSKDSKSIESMKNPSIKRIGSKRRRKKSSANKKRHGILAEVNDAGLVADKVTLGGIEEQLGLIVAGTSAGKLMTFKPGSAAYKAGTIIAPNASIDSIIPFERGYVLIGCSDGLVRICEVDNTIIIKDAIPCSCDKSLVYLVNLMEKDKDSEGDENEGETKQTNGDDNCINDEDDRPKILIVAGLGSTELSIFKRTNSLLECSPTLSPMISPSSSEDDDYSSENENASNRTSNITSLGAKSVTSPSSSSSSISWEDPSSSSDDYQDIESKRAPNDNKVEKECAILNKKEKGSPNSLKSISSLKKLSKHARRNKSEAKRMLFFRDLDDDDSD